MFLVEDWLNGFFGWFLTTYRLFFLNKLLVVRSILTRSVLFFVLHFICLFIIFISNVFQPLFLLHVFFFLIALLWWFMTLLQFSIELLSLILHIMICNFFFIVLLFSLTLHHNFLGCVVMYSFFSSCFHQGISYFLHHNCLFFFIVPWFCCDALCMFLFYFLMW